MQSLGQKLIATFILTMGLSAWAQTETSPEPSGTTVYICNREENGFVTERYVIFFRNTSENSDSITDSYFVRISGTINKTVAVQRVDYSWIKIKFFFVVDDVNFEIDNSLLYSPSTGSLFKGSEQPVPIVCEDTSRGLP